MRDEPEDKSDGPTAGDQTGQQPAIIIDNVTVMQGYNFAVPFAENVTDTEPDTTPFALTGDVKTLALQVTIGFNNFGTILPDDFNVAGKTLKLLFDTFKLFPIGPVKLEHNPVNIGDCRKMGDDFRHRRSFKF